MKKTRAALIPSLVGLMTLALVPIAAQQPDVAQSSSARFHRKGLRAIPNHYIVVLDRDATGRQGDLAFNAAEIAQLMPEWAGTVTHRYNHAVRAAGHEPDRGQPHQVRRGRFHRRSVRDPE